MFKMSPSSLQTFIDTPKCVLEDRVQYSTVHIPNVFCDGHIQIINFFYCNRQVHRDFLITLYKITNSVISVHSAPFLLAQTGLATKTTCRQHVSLIQSSTVRRIIMKRRWLAFTDAYNRTGCHTYTVLICNIPFTQQMQCVTKHQSWSSPFLASALYSMNPFTCQHTHSDTQYHRRTTL
jgi:hypothetical protein